MLAVPAGRTDARVHAQHAAAYATTSRQAVTIADSRGACQVTMFQYRYRTLDNDCKSIATRPALVDW